MSARPSLRHPLEDPSGPLHSTSVTRLPREGDSKTSQLLLLFSPAGEAISYLGIV